MSAVKGQKPILRCTLQRLGEAGDGGGSATAATAIVEVTAAVATAASGNDGLRRDVGEKRAW